MLQFVRKNAAALAAIGPDIKDASGVIAFLFSGVALLLVNLVVTGELLAYLLGLSDEGESKIRIKIKQALHLGTKGQKFVAGLAAYTVSLFLVGIYMTPYARKIFIVNLELTDQMRVAAQLLATSIAVVCCVISCSAKLILVNVRSVARKPLRDPADAQARVSAMISENNQDED